MGNGVRDLILQFQLERVAQELEALALPSIRLGVDPADESELQPGTSRVGGEPDLPPGVEWPVWDYQPARGPLEKDVPLAFLAQLRLTDLAGHEAARELPPDGILSFFYDANQGAWGDQPEDRGSWRVFHLPEADLPTLQPVPLPPTLTDYGRFAGCRVTFTSELTLPAPSSPEIASLGLDPDEAGRYTELRERLVGEQGPSRLLGHPDLIQEGGDMREDCQRASRGLSVRDWRDLPRPRQEELVAEALDWRLLLQLDSEPAAGMCWGDMGKLYFWTRPESLAAQDFSEAWMLMQCY